MNFDISAASLAAGNRGNFSVGGLIGYDFGPVTAQAYVATTVANANVNRRTDTVEGWFRLIVPLYSPTAVAAAAPAPIIRKY